MPLKSISVHELYVGERKLSYHLQLPPSPFSFLPPSLPPVPSLYNLLPKVRPEEAAWVPPSPLSEEGGGDGGGGSSGTGSGAEGSESEMDVDGGVDLGPLLPSSERMMLCTQVAMREKGGGGGCGRAGGGGLRLLFQELRRSSSVVGVWWG